MTAAARHLADDAPGAVLDPRQEGVGMMTRTERTTRVSPQDLIALGLDHMAYVKPVTVDGEAAYAVHAADGTEVAVMADRAAAVAAIHQHDLEAVSVH
jgi:hypothetical protein